MNMLSTICSNPWCKGTFTFPESDIVELPDGSKSGPKQCPKCVSFDTQLSGGVTWKDKSYEGNRFDNMPHEIRYKVTNYYR
jgi:hypothetical protein